MCEKSEVESVDVVPVLSDLVSADLQKRRRALEDLQLGYELGAYFEMGIVKAETSHLPVKCGGYWAREHSTFTPATATS